MKSLEVLAQQQFKSRLVWYFRQLFPLTYWTTFDSGNYRSFAIWKMWLGRCYRIIHITYQILEKEKEN